MKRPFLFICMPITPRSQHLSHAVEFLQYIRHGAEVGTELIRRGAAVYNPGNDVFFWLCTRSGVEEHHIYDQDFNIIDRADGLVVLENWQISPNCKREIERTELQNKPVFYWNPVDNSRLFGYIEQWVKENNV